MISLGPLHTAHQAHVVLARGEAAALVLGSLETPVATRQEFQPGPCWV